MAALLPTFDARLSDSSSVPFPRRPRGDDSPQVFPDKPPKSSLELEQEPPPPTRDSSDGVSSLDKVGQFAPAREASDTRRVQAPMAPQRGHEAPSNCQ
jgi:hypothetical protein